jgi:hypothetical protein
MVRLVWLVVVLGGCTLGGGLSLGYRAGKPTVGWEAGLGVVDYNEGRSGGGLRMLGGQSWRSGRPFSYGSLAVDFLRHPEGSDDTFYGAGGAIGGGGGDGEGARLLVGVDPFVGATYGDSSCGTQRVLTLSLGARAIGNDLEIYLAPRIAAVGNVCVH